MNRAMYTKNIVKEMVGLYRRNVSYCTGSISCVASCPV